MEKMNLDNLEIVAGGQYDPNGPTLKATVKKTTQIYSSRDVKNATIIKYVHPGDTVIIYRDFAMRMDGYDWRIVKREPEHKNAYIDGYCLY